MSADAPQAEKQAGRPLDALALDSRSRGFAAWMVLAGDIKLAHSVFAMPFAILGAFLAHPASDTWTRFGAQLGLIIICMVSARTTAMLSNRILDRNIDAENPRTKSRAIASGRVALRDAVVASFWSAAVFVVVCGAFGFAFDNWWPFLLSLPILAWIGAYPLTKHITWLCHLYLGSSLAISPVAAAIAIDPSSITHTPALWYISGLVLTWVAGFDVIYALQDVAIDRDKGLKSIPARFGESGALWISRLLHLISILFLIGMYVREPRLQTAWFGGAIALVLLLLIIEHAVTAKHGTGRIQLTFFTLNGIISCVLGAAGIFSVVLSTS